MPGFSNTILYADNVDFSGNSTVTAQMVSDGDLLIGSSVSPNIRVGTLTSSDGSITFTPGNGTLSLQAVSTPLTFKTDSTNATPSSNQIKIAGGSGITTAGAGNVVTITNTSPGSSLTITGDSGGALSPNWTIAGSGSITTSGSGSTLTVALQNLTNHALLVGAGTSTITKVASGSTGQVLQTNTGADPTWSTATFPSTATGTGKVLVADGTNWVASTPTFPNASATSGKIIISDGTNWIASTPTFPNSASGTGTILRANGTNWVATTTTYPTTTTASQILYSSSTNVIGEITAANNGTLVTSSSGVPSILAGPGVANKILMSVAAAAPAWSTPTYPNASVTAGKVIVSDGTNYIASTPTFPNSSASSGKIIISDGTNWIASTPTYPNSSATAGKVLISDGTNFVASTPTYPNASATSGKIIISDGTNFISSTPTYPNAASTALKHIKSDGTNFVTTTVTYPDASVTAGKVIVSDGTNYIASTPTFPNASATTNKVIKSDGTNWVASTETYAAPSTSGNVMTSDGTNWTSAAAPSGNLLIATKTLTSSQIKNLHATPIEIVAAPGAGKAIIPINVSYKFVYGGSNVFVAGAGQAIRLFYNNNTTTVFSSAFVSNSILVSSTTSYSTHTNITVSPTDGSAAGVLDNVNVALYNSISTEISGNAANDNTINVQFSYYIITF